MAWSDKARAAAAAKRKRRGGRPKYVLSAKGKKVKTPKGVKVTRSGLVMNEFGMPMN